MAADEGPLPEIAQNGPYYRPLNVFTASKGLNFYIYYGVFLRSYFFSLKKVQVGKDPVFKCLCLYCMSC